MRVNSCCGDDWRFCLLWFWVLLQHCTSVGMPLKYSSLPAHPVWNHSSVTSVPPLACIMHQAHSLKATLRMTQLAIGSCKLSGYRGSLVCTQALCGRTTQSLGMRLDMEADRWHMIMTPPPLHALNMQWLIHSPWSRHTPCMAAIEGFQIYSMPRFLFTGWKLMLRSKQLVGFIMLKSVGWLASIIQQLQELSLTQNSNTPSFMHGWNWWNQIDHECCDPHTSKCPQLGVEFPIKDTFPGQWWWWGRGACSLLGTWKHASFFGA